MNFPRVGELWVFNDTIFDVIIDVDDDTILYYTVAPSGPTTQCVAKKSVSRWMVESGYAKVS